MLTDTRVTIVGLGLMGGSLSRALRGKCAGLAGVDVKPEVVTRAVREGFVDQASTELAKGLAGADLCILAEPVRAILDTLEGIAELTKGPLAVMDLGSTKRDVVRAMQALPSQVDAIGGHPMCGKEHAGLEHADGALFQGAAFALTPSTRTSEGLRALAQELVAAVGARPIFMDAERHDRLVGAISHLPYLSSSLLVELAQAVDDPGVWDLAGPGFRDSTRLAASDTTMMMDILMTNRDVVLAWLGRYKQLLSSLEETLQSGDEAVLATRLQSSQARRASIFQPGRAASQADDGHSG